MATAVRLARQALRKTTADADTLWQAGWTLFSVAGEPAAGMMAVDRAVAQYPNSAEAWGCKGYMHALRGQSALAIDALDRGMRLSPFDPIRHHLHGGRAIAYLAARDYISAIDWADRALQDQPLDLQALRVKIVSNAKLGHLDEARAVLNRLLTIEPGWTIANWRTWAAAIAPAIQRLRESVAAGGQRAQALCAIHAITLGEIERLTGWLISIRTSPSIAVAGRGQ